MGAIRELIAFAAIMLLVIAASKAGVTQIELLPGDDVHIEATGWNDTAHFKLVSTFSEMTDNTTIRVYDPAHNFTKSITIISKGRANTTIYTEGMS